MAKIWLPKGTKWNFHYRTQEEFDDECANLIYHHGNPIFEMPWPNKRIFKVFRDKHDNQIEIDFIPTTIGEFA